MSAGLSAWEVRRLLAVMADARQCLFDASRAAMNANDPMWTRLAEVRGSLDFWHERLTEKVVQPLDVENGS